MLLCTLLLASGARASNWGGAGVPASFDCSMRKAAYLFGAAPDVVCV